MSCTNHLNLHSTLTLRCPVEFTAPHLVEFRKELELRFGDHEMSARRWSVLELDLTSTNRVDSAGLSVLISVIRRAGKGKLPVRMRVGTRALARVLRFTRLDRLVEVVAETP